LHKARELPKDEFKREVSKHLTGKETEPWEILYFMAYKSQLPVIEQALETAAQMLGSDKSRGYCLEMICADFLAEVSLERRGKRDYVQVLRLLESFSMAEVTQAIEDALRMRAISFDAVKHLLLCRIEQRPPRLDLENYPHLPVAQVATTAATDYLELLTSPQEGGC
jgi:hypothetical protein